MLKLKIGDIEPNPWNSNFLNKDEFKALKKQMKKSGLENTPSIIVRRRGKKYEIIDGEQRYKIAKELGWEKINATLIDADDLKAKNLCISYNRWRGRLDWFKLCDVILQDAKAGIDIYEAYKGALSEEEINELFSLRNIVPEARKILRQVLEESKETTLEHLYIISCFPKDRQGIVARKFQERPCSVAALRVLLNQTIMRPHETVEEKEETEKVVEEAEEIPEKPQVSVVEEETKPFQPEPSPMSVLSTEYKCPCGREYVIIWKKHDLIILSAVRKGTRGYEHVSSESTRPHEVMVKCPKCETENKIFIEGQKQEMTCWRCKLQGMLDVEAGEAKWEPLR